MGDAMPLLRLIVCAVLTHRAVTEPGETERADQGLTMISLDILMTIRSRRELRKGWDDPSLWGRNHPKTR